jgi:MFS family permease
MPSRSLQRWCGCALTAQLKTDAHSFPIDFELSKRTGLGTMYSFEVASYLKSTAASAAAGPKAPVPRVVYWIGLSSLLADVSAEIVASALPIFLFSVLQFSPLQVGLLDGLYQGGAALVSVMAAYIADRRRRNRLVAFTGYALSCVSRVGLLLSANFGMLAAVLSLSMDRVGKGIRTAPRDAIIAAHTPAQSMGAAFGVHRSMDAVGAFVGPLLGAGLLWWSPERYEWIFVASILFGAAGLVVFKTKVREPIVPVESAASGSDSTMPATNASNSAPLPIRTAFGLLTACKPFVRLILLAVLLCTFTISDGLLYLVLQREGSFSGAAVPLMFAATALVFLLAAVPLGRAADRIGPVRMFLMGYAVLAIAYLSVAFGSHSNGLLVVLVVALLGLHYAATDGVLVAIAARVLDERVRTTGLAVLSSATGFMRIASSAFFGLLWQYGGQHAVVSVFAVGMVCCCVAAVLTLRRLGRPELVKT